MNEEATDESTPTGKALGNVAAVALGIGATAGLLFGGAAVTKGIGKMVRESAKNKANGSTKMSRIVDKITRDGTKNGSRDVMEKTKRILNNIPLKEGEEYSGRQIRKATKQAKRDIVGEREYAKSLREMRQEAESAKPKTNKVDVTEDLDEFETPTYTRNQEKNQEKDENVSKIEDNSGLVNPIMKKLIKQAEPKAIDYNTGNNYSTQEHKTDSSQFFAQQDIPTVDIPKKNEASNGVSTQDIPKKNGTQHQEENINKNAKTSNFVFDESDTRGSRMDPRTEKPKDYTTAPDGGWNINGAPRYDQNVPIAFKQEPVKKFDESNMNGVPMREEEKLNAAPDNGWNININKDATSTHTTPVDNTLSTPVTNTSSGQEEVDKMYQDRMKWRDENLNKTPSGKTGPYVSTPEDVKAGWDAAQEWKANNRDRKPSTEYLNRNK